MKTINELTKAEKIAFLRQIQAGKINPKDFNQPPVFLTQRGDAFLSLMQGKTDTVPITPEAIKDLELLKESINS